MSVSKRCGRRKLPPGMAKTARIQLRIRPQDKILWQQKADEVGKTLHQWIEDRCKF